MTWSTYLSFRLGHIYVKVSITKQLKMIAITCRGARYTVAECCQEGSVRQAALDNSLADIVKALVLKRDLIQ
eukprot:Awhi_evm2s4456